MRDRMVIAGRVLGVAIVTVLGSCKGSEPVGMDPGEPEQVMDLAVMDVTESSITLGWTQVEDGDGDPANYALRYGSPTLTWGSASDTEVSVNGVAVGQEASHTYSGLASASGYEFQLVSLRGTLDVDAVFGPLSNVVTASTEAPPVPLTVGAISALPGDGEVTLSGPDATGGTPPYAYQWHRSTTSGFAADPGSALSGLTALAEVDTDVTNGTTYFYRLSVTDDVGGTAASDEASATPAAGGGGEVLLLHEDWTGGIDTNRWEAGYRAEHHSVVDDPTGEGRGQVLRAEHTDNGGASHLATWIYGAAEANPTGEIFLRTSLYIPPDFDGSNYAKMLIIKGNRTDDLYSSFGQAGIPANGTNFFESYVSNGAPSHGDPGVHFYTYHVDMPGNYGHISYTRATDPAARLSVPGAWHKFEFWLRQNTVGQSDGELRFWMDDVLMMEWTGLRFRTDEILQANAVAVTFSSSDNQGQVWYADDVFVYDRLPSGMAEWP